MMLMWSITTLGSTGAAAAGPGEAGAGGDATVGVGCASGPIGGRSADGTLWVFSGNRDFGLGAEGCGTAAGGDRLVGSAGSDVL